MLTLACRITPHTHHHINCMTFWRMIFTVGNGMKFTFQKCMCLYLVFSSFTHRSLYFFFFVLFSSSLPPSPVFLLLLLLFFVHRMGVQALHLTYTSWTLRHISIDFPLKRKLSWHIVTCVFPRKISMREISLNRILRCVYSMHRVRRSKGERKREGKKRM